MTLPLCALCGGPLTQRACRSRRDGTVTVDHTREPNRPRYGWHMACHAVDPLRRGESPSLTDAEIAIVDARGPGRVVRRRS